MQNCLLNFFCPIKQWTQMNAGLIDSSGENKKDNPQTRTSTCMCTKTFRRKKRNFRNCAPNIITALGGLLGNNLLHATISHNWLHLVCVSSHSASSSLHLHGMPQIACTFFARACRKYFSFVFSIQSRWNSRNMILACTGRPTSASVSLRRPATF